MVMTTTTTTKLASRDGCIDNIESAEETVKWIHLSDEDEKNSANDENYKKTQEGAFDREIVDEASMQRSAIESTKDADKDATNDSVSVDSASSIGGVSWPEVAEGTIRYPDGSYDGVSYDSGTTSEMNGRRDDLGNDEVSYGRQDEETDGVFRGKSGGESEGVFHGESEGHFQGESEGVFQGESDGNGSESNASSSNVSSNDEAFSKDGRYGPSPPWGLLL